jgi:hypothetical protein
VRVERMTSAFEQTLRGAHRPLSTAELTASGVTRAMTRGRAWHRTSRGFFRPAIDTPLTTTQRILDAGPLVPSTGALAGWAAAYVHGVDLLDGLDPYSMRALPAEICLGSDAGRASSDQVRYSRDPLSDRHREVRHGLWVTTAMRTAFDGGRWAGDLVEAVVFVDQVAHVLPIDLPALSVWGAGLIRWRGIRQLRAALAFVDPASASPWESRLRMFYVLEAGLPRPLVNVPVFTPDGRFLAVPDLLESQAGLVTEFDGQDHCRRRQHRDDNLREEKLEGVNLTVCRVDSLDLRSSLALKDRLQARHLQGTQRDRRRDGWTLEQPSWWRRKHAS